MIITAKSDYIYSANSTYYNLMEYENLLAKEAKIVDYVKCALLRNEELDDFWIDDVVVSVYGGGNQYALYFDEYKMDIEVYDKQIVSMNVVK